MAFKIDVRMFQRVYSTCVIFILLPFVYYAHSSDDDPAMSSHADLSHHLLRVGVANVSRLINHERRLHHYLMDEYDRSVRPVENETSAIAVTFGMNSIVVVHLDETTQVLSLFAWLNFQWRDVQLRWNEDEFGGVKNIRVPISDLWTPDIYPYNSNDAHFQLGNTNAVIRSNGDVDWVPMTSLNVHCPLDLTKFPYDRQTCFIKFGSWTYDGTQMDLSLRDISPSGTDLDFSTVLRDIDAVQTEWEVTGIKSHINRMTYDCCPEPYVDVTYSISLKRHSTFATHLFVAPSVVLSLIIPVVFILPPDGGEKMTLGVGILIAHVLLLGELIDYTPGIHRTAPLIARYFLANIALVSLSLVLSAVIINAWNRSRTRCTGPPACIRVAFLGPLARVLCVSKELHVSVDGGGASELGPGGAAPHRGTFEVLTDGEEPLTSSRERCSGDDRGQLVQNYQRRAAMSEWRRLATVCDRLLLVLFVFVIVFITLCFTEYL